MMNDLPEESKKINYMVDNRNCWNYFIIIYDIIHGC